jgi:hypothetical protein
MGYVIQWRNIQCIKKDRIFSNQSLRKLVYDMTITLMNNEIMKLWKQKEELKLEIQTSLNLIQRIYFWQIYSDKIIYFMILIWKKWTSLVASKVNEIIKYDWKWRFCCCDECLTHQGTMMLREMYIIWTHLHGSVLNLVHCNLINLFNTQIAFINFSLTQK